MSIELIIATFENDERRAEEVLKNAKALAKRASLKFLR
jgi:hypothetical protein